MSEKQSSPASKIVSAVAQKEPENSRENSQQNQTRPEDRLVEGGTQKSGSDPKSESNGAKLEKSPIKDGGKAVRKMTQTSLKPKKNANSISKNKPAKVDKKEKRETSKSNGNIKNLFGAKVAAI